VIEANPGGDDEITPHEEPLLEGEPVATIPWTEDETKDALEYTTNRYCANKGRETLVSAKCKAQGEEWMTVNAKDNIGWIELSWVELSEILVNNVHQIIYILIKLLCPITIHQVIYLIRIRL
jgi:hypothetical protein